MAGGRTVFFCSTCGQKATRWTGRCPGCGEWNTMVEESLAPNTGVWLTAQPGDPPVPINEVPGEEKDSRISTGFEELDHVLGGGVVPGSLVLLGGEPGIGKSTILLQVAQHISGCQKRVLYVSGEESLRQIRLRAVRLGTLGENIFLVAENNLDRIRKHIRELDPELVIVDSVQTVFSSELSAAPGSVGQVRQATWELSRMAKDGGPALILVGHVTKDGMVAGPKVLEHMVDAVLYFESDSQRRLHVVRAVKNRFGSINEIGIFEMRDTGLQEVKNPSRIFLAQRPLGVSGSVVVAGLEGSRPILFEIQSLVTRSTFGNPRRLATGMDPQRVLLLVAVLEKRLGADLASKDIYLNVTGGIRIEETAADAGICLAIASSLLDRPVPSDLVVTGEVGLVGEIRAVGQVERRVQEAFKMGFSRCLVPKGDIRLGLAEGFEINATATLEEVLEFALGGL